MLVAGSVVFVAVSAAFAAYAAFLAGRHGITFRQAFLYAPLKLSYRIDDDRLRALGAVPGPVIYAIVNQSPADPAIALSLLPDNTLHILDETSARSPWLEPFRELARTIAFNTTHVFVSRRLVRHLKGGGRLAVYLPNTVEPDQRTFRLFRAVARIAMAAEAKVVPIFIKGSRRLPYSPASRLSVPKEFFPKLTISALEPMTLAQIAEAGGPRKSTVSGALFDRVAEARVLAADPARTLFSALRDAAIRFGPARIIIEDSFAGTMTYRQMLQAVRVLAGRFLDIDQPGEAVGVLLPNSNGAALAFFALQSSGRVAAMLNYTAGDAVAGAAVRAVGMRTVISSRAFVEKAQLKGMVAAIEQAGARLVWLDDLRSAVTTFDKIVAALSWTWAARRTRADDPAVILFTSGSEGLPKGVVLTHRNLLANVAQVEARIAFSPQDKLLNVLPVFHSFGLTGGTILPLTSGIRIYIYPTPLHYKQIPELAAKLKPTVMFGTDTFLAAYARTAKDTDFASLRMVVAGAEPVRQQTRHVWRERFGTEILEGFGMTEASPVVAVNSATHGRDGTVGRLLPLVRVRLEPVEGIEEGGQLWISGPNVMQGYMTAEWPGTLQPPAHGWHDTGDIVSFDREGFVTIKGRAKRFAKIAGEVVSLAAVEVLVHALWPEEKHAVVALSDERRGERIVLVTTAGEAERAAMQQLARKQGTSELLLPQDIVKIAEMPVLGTGKIDYAQARRLAATALGIEKAA